MQNERCWDRLKNGTHSKLLKNLKIPNYETNSYYNKSGCDLAWTFHFMKYTQSAHGGEDKK